MRLRFSIRALLILTALAAAVCYWWIAGPSSMANKFKRALEQGDMATIRNLWIYEGRSFLDRADSPSPFMPVQRWQIELEPRSWTDLTKRIRRMKVALRESTDDNSNFITEDFSGVIASAKGVYMEPVPYKGGGFF